jgi:adenylate cyclase
VDAEYGEALGTLIDVVASRTMQGRHESWARGSEEACQLAGRALATGPDSSTCVASAAFTYGVLAYRFEEALDLADRALMLHPNSVLVRNRAGDRVAGPRIDRSFWHSDQGPGLVQLVSARR